MVDLRRSTTRNGVESLKRDHVQILFRIIVASYFEDTPEFENLFSATEACNDLYSCHVRTARKKVFNDTQGV